MVPLSRRSLCWQKPLKGGLGLTRLTMCRHMLSLRDHWLYLDGDQAWSPHVKLLLSHLRSLWDLEPRIKTIPKIGEWYKACKQALLVFFCTSNSGVGGGNHRRFYRGLVEYMPDLVLWETLGFDRSHIINMFGGIFGPRSVNNFQKSLAWLCYWYDLALRERVSSHGGNLSTMCPRSERASETVVHAFFVLWWIKKKW